jgi:hypothetical protein
MKQWANTVGTGSGRRTSIHVVVGSSHVWGSGGEAHLIVHVPANSSLTVTLVSSDFEVKGVLGDLKVQSMSGNGRFKSVSGDMIVGVCLRPRVMSADCSGAGSPLSCTIPAPVTALRSSNEFGHRFICIHLVALAPL